MGLRLCKPLGTQVRTANISQAQLCASPLDCVSNHSTDVSSAAGLALPLLGGHKAMNRRFCVGLSEVHYQQLPEISQAAFLWLYIQRS